MKMKIGIFGKVIELIERDQLYVLINKIQFDHDFSVLFTGLI